eukprot:CAMPEP_0194747166 /NCGR_PEP_ID=MMETSP0323_2-20130528/1246_1 /TAXON_ID=2866 ORGANISM="Crypthecodinium cohnii, Strain Seligo" /NCGR_SAMPLE_ID=MMETSP0323_2 /ASSEMBLY_ACC=CAM_ASM_000346 /LENGTH=42 /DNA_ID= /DNA_START= /DNA_END= /DNA_ORIENTATION=
MSWPTSAEMSKRGLPMPNKAMMMVERGEGRGEGKGAGDTLGK